MKLVIDIQEETYNKIRRGEPLYSADENVAIFAIETGTPLPKGHGRLIDADAFSGDMFCFADLTDQHTCYYSICNLLDNAQTIIEADKEGDAE